MKVIGLRSEAARFASSSAVYNGLDFSACSRAELRRAALNAAATVFGPTIPMS